MIFLNEQKLAETIRKSVDDALEKPLQELDVALKPQREKEEAERKAEMESFTKELAEEEKNRVRYSIAKRVRDGRQIWVVHIWHNTYQSSKNKGLEFLTKKDALKYIKTGDSGITIYNSKGLVITNKIVSILDDSFGQIDINITDKEGKTKCTKN